MVECGSENTQGGNRGVDVNSMPQAAFHPANPDSTSFENGTCAALTFPHCSTHTQGHPPRHTLTPTHSHLVPLVVQRVQVGGGKVLSQLGVRPRPAGNANARAAGDGGLGGGVEACEHKGEGAPECVRVGAACLRKGVGCDTQRSLQLLTPPAAGRHTCPSVLPAWSTPVPASPAPFARLVTPPPLPASAPLCLSLPSHSPPCNLPAQAPATHQTRSWCSSGP